jgi:hypothetical protein
MSARSDSVRGYRDVFDDSRAYGRHAAYVGASITQTPGAQAQEIAQIDDGIKMLDADLEREVKGRGQVGRPYSASDVIAAATHGKAALDALLASYHPAPSADKLMQFYQGAWVPFFNRWVAFTKENKDGAWWSNPAAVAEGYYHQLLQLRSQAKSSGAHLLSPEPQLMDTNPLGGISDFFGSLANGLKTGLWVALGLGATFAAVTIYNSARGRR